MRVRFCQCSCFHLSLLLPRPLHAEQGDRRASQDLAEVRRRRSGEREADSKRDSSSQPIDAPTRERTDRRTDAGHNATGGKLVQRRASHTGIGSMMRRRVRCSYALMYRCVHSLSSHVTGTRGARSRGGRGRLSLPLCVVLCVLVLCSLSCCVSLLCVVVCSLRPFLLLLLALAIRHCVCRSGRCLTSHRSDSSKQANTSRARRTRAEKATERKEARTHFQRRELIGTRGTRQPLTHSSRRLCARGLA